MAGRAQVPVGFGPTVLRLVYLRCPKEEVEARKRVGEVGLTTDSGESRPSQPAGRHVRFGAHSGHSDCNA